jgi:hypothetical protein
MLSIFCTVDNSVLTGEVWGINFLLKRSSQITNRNESGQQSFFLCLWVNILSNCNLILYAKNSCTN